MLAWIAELVDVERHAAPVVGPTRWWDGPLDVEALLLGSARCALTAANALARAGGAGRPGPLSVDAAAVAGSATSMSHLRVGGRRPAMFTGLSGFFPTADGWIRTHGNYPHHAAALGRALGLGAGAGREEVGAALAGIGAGEAENRIVGAGGVAGAVRARREWLATPMSSAVAADPWIRFRGLGEPPAEPPTPDRLRVLDLTRVIAGPTGTRLLASLGADVLRVDPPDRPELLDQYLDNGAGKRSALADLTDPAAAERVRQLALGADVVVTGYRPRALDRFGLTAPALLEASPRLAVVHLDAWGDVGPWGGRRGFDSVVQAVTGIADLYAGDDGVPGALPCQALDHAVGHGVAAAALALAGRGGAAHLSLARTAEELVRLTGRPGAQEQGAPRLPAPALVGLDSPHGRLTQVAPLVGAVRPPGAYGGAALAWRRRPQR